MVAVEAHRRHHQRTVSVKLAVDVAATVLAVPFALLIENVLANFPERNEEAYAQVAARAAAARAAEQAQVAAEDDEDDDDWRKYL